MGNRMKAKYYAKIRGSNFVRGFDSMKERDDWVARTEGAIKVRKHNYSYLEIKDGQS